MTIDFVVHGDTGVAGPWALAAQPGDELVLQGPGGAYAPAADVDAHVLIGDEAALPAIAAACERVAPGAPVHVFVEVDGPDDELALDVPGRAVGALGVTARPARTLSGVRALRVVARGSGAGVRARRDGGGEGPAAAICATSAASSASCSRSPGTGGGEPDEEAFQADKRARIGVAA